MNAKLEARCTIGFVNFVELYLFCGNISDLYHTHFQSPVLFNATFSNILPLFGAVGLSDLAVDFVHNLHVSGETCER